MSSADSESSVEGALHYVLPENFGLIPNGADVWRGVKLSRRLHVVLEKVYGQRPGTFVGLVSLESPVEQTRVCRKLGQLVRRMLETAFADTSFFYFDEVRVSLGDLERRGLHLSWLRDCVDMAYWKYWYAEATARRQHWTSVRAEIDASLYALQGEMLRSYMLRRREGTLDTLEGEVEAKTFHTTERGRLSELKRAEKSVVGATASQRLALSRVPTAADVDIFAFVGDGLFYV